MNDSTLIQALINELLNSFNNYLARIDNNNGTREHRHLSQVHKQRIKLVTELVGGGLFFAPIVGPGLGNLVKSGGPVVIEEIANLHYDRLNKKIDNAGKVIDYVGNNSAVFFRKIAEQVVRERQGLINNLSDNAKTQQRVARFLAANILASVKHNASHHNNSLNAKVNETANDLENTRSQKVFDSPSLKLKPLASNR